MNLVASVKALLGQTEGYADPEAAASQEVDDQQSATAAEETPAAEANAEHTAEVDETEDHPEAAAEEDLSEDDEEEPENEEGLSDEQKLDRKKSRQTKKVLREIAKRKEAETERDRLKAKVEQLEARLPDSETGFSFQSEADIESRRMQLRNLIREVDAHILKGGYESEDGKTSLDVDELNKMKFELEDERDLALPKAAKRIQERKRIEQEVVAKSYPDLLDPDTELSKEAAKLFETIPSLKLHPEGLVLVGDLLRGRKLRTGSKPAPQKVKAPPSAKVPPKEPGRGADTRSGVSTESTNTDDALLQAVGRRVLSQNLR